MLDRGMVDMGLVQECLDELKYQFGTNLYGEQEQYFLQMVSAQMQYAQKAMMRGIPLFDEILRNQEITGSLPPDCNFSEG